MEAEPPKAEPAKRKRRRFQFRLRTLMTVTAMLAVACWVVTAGIPRGIRQWLHPLGDNEFDMTISNLPVASQRPGDYELSFTVYSNAPFAMEFRLSKTDGSRSVAKVPSSSQLIGYRAALRCRVKCNDGTLRVYDARGVLLSEFQLGKSKNIADVIEGSHEGSIGAWYLLSRHTPGNHGSLGASSSNDGDLFEYAVIRSSAD